MEHDFPADGEYELNIANMAQALWVYNMEFENTLIVTLDGKRFYETKIGGEEDMKSIDQKQDPAVDAINKRLKNIRFNATAGQHKSPSRSCAAALPSPTIAFAAACCRAAARSACCASTPSRSAARSDGTGFSETPSRKRIFTCYPQTRGRRGAVREQIVAHSASAPSAGR